MPITQDELTTLRTVMQRDGQYGDPGISVGGTKNGGGPLSVITTIPMHLPAGENLREHWAVKSKRIKRHRGAGALAAKGAKRLGFPLVVTLTRIARRDVDEHDNLRNCFKHVVDGIAKELGVDDADKARIAWVYAPQERGEPAARIKIERVLR